LRIAPILTGRIFVKTLDKKFFDNKIRKIFVAEVGNPAGAGSKFAV
jgi:hypothetical protein